MSRLGKLIILFSPCGSTSTLQSRDPDVPAQSQGSVLAGVPGSQMTSAIATQLPKPSVANPLLPWPSRVGPFTAMVRPALSPQSGERLFLNSCCYSF